MADEKAPTLKEYQLLADGMIVDGEERKRGDTIKIDKDHGELLERFGSVGPVGILERREKAAKDSRWLRDEAEKDPDTSTDAGDEAARRPAGRPRNG